MVNPADILAKSADTFRERDKVYGRGWPRVGQVLLALFPDGVTLTTAKDHERFSQLVMLSVKLTRYANNFHKGGHQDSVHDMIVYAAILESIDEEMNDVATRTAADGVSNRRPSRR